MMNDDDFAPNPFRTNNDFLDQTPSAQQHMQDPFQQQQTTYPTATPTTSYQDPFQQQPQPTQQMQQQPYYGQSQQQQMPDPNSGLTGTFAPSPTSVGPPSPPALSGTMDQNNAPPPPQPTNHGLWSVNTLLKCCNLDTLHQLFNVDSADVAARLRGSLLHGFRPDHFRTVILLQETEGDQQKGPDLYGPVWLSYTGMFLLGIVSNLSAYMHFDKESEQEFEYDLQHVLNALYVVFGLVFGVSSAFWFLCTCLGLNELAWSMWVCLYGYSLTPILLCLVVSWWLPSHLWHWLCLGIGVGLSGLLIVRNVSSPLLQQNPATASPVILGILGVHAVYLFVFKWTFF